MDNKILAHTQYNCTYHIVFIPKYRRKVMYGRIGKEVGDILFTVYKISGKQPLLSGYRVSFSFSTGLLELHNIFLHKYSHIIQEFLRVLYFLSFLSASQFAISTILIPSY